MSDSNTDLSSQLLSLRERVTAGLTNISGIESRLSEHVGSTNAHSELFAEKAPISAVEETNTTLADLENRVSLLKNTVDALIGGKADSSFLGYSDQLVIENKFNETVKLDVPPIDDDPANAVTYSLWSGEFLSGITFDPSTGTITTGDIVAGTTSTVILAKSGNYGKYITVVQRYTEISDDIYGLINRLRSGDIEGLVGAELYMWLAGNTLYNLPTAHSSKYTPSISDVTSQSLSFNGKTYKRYKSGDVSETDTTGVKVYKKVCWSSGSGEEDKIYTNNFAVYLQTPVFNNNGDEIGVITKVPTFMKRYKVVVTEVDNPNVECLNGRPHFARLEFVNAPIHCDVEGLFDTVNKKSMQQLTALFANQRVPAMYNDFISPVSITGNIYNNFIVPSTKEYVGNMPASQVKFSVASSGASTSSANYKTVPEDGSPVPYNNSPDILYYKTKGVGTKSIQYLMTRDTMASFKDGVPDTTGQTVYLCPGKTRVTIKYEIFNPEDSYWCAPAFYIS